MASQNCKFRCATQNWVVKNERFNSSRTGGHQPELLADGGRRHVGKTLKLAAQSGNGRVNMANEPIYPACFCPRLENQAIWQKSTKNNER